MELLYVVQGLLTVLMTVIGYLWTRNDSKLDEVRKEFANYRTHVAEQYVQKDALKELRDALFVKLDKIENKLDNKQDKP